MRAMISNYFRQIFRNLPSWTLNWKGKNPEITLTAWQNSMCFLVRRACMKRVLVPMCACIRCKWNRCKKKMLIGSATDCSISRCSSVIVGNVWWAIQCIHWNVMMNACFNDCFARLAIERTHFGCVFCEYIRPKHTLHLRQIYIELSFFFSSLYIHSVFSIPTINNRQWSN